MPLYALNLFDLAENEQYLHYSRRITSPTTEQERV
jgi:hypothetical protein